MGQNNQRNAQLEKENKELLYMYTAMKQGMKTIEQERKQFEKEKKDLLEKVSLLLMALMQGKITEVVINNETKMVKIDGIDYHIYQFVERGGFGEIYKARSEDKREVAVKFIRATSNIQGQIDKEVRFLKLARMVTIENNPVIEYYGCQNTQQGIYIALELADHDLYHFWVDRVSKANKAEKFMIGVLIFMYVLRALVFLEKLNIVHGDIKPGNLVVIERQNIFLVKLIDFGTVERFDTKRSQKTVGTGKAYTPLFVAPEFLNFSNPTSSKRMHKKADAWSAGVMFYYLLNDTFPFENENAYIQFANKPDAVDIKAPETDGFEDIIHLLLKKKPEQRSTSEQAMINMKSHDKLKTTVDALEKKFYQVDDVCQLVIPDELRKQLVERKDN